MYRENPEETDDRQYYDYHLDRNGSPLESELKQQTAVEQFAIALYEKGLLTGNGDDMQELLEQSKTMEKEKMIEFAQEVFRNRYNQITQSLGNIADDIYNETYGVMTNENQ